MIVPVPGISRAMWFVQSYLTPRAIACDIVQRPIAGAALSNL